MEKRRNWNASDYFRLINIETGKILATFLVLLALSYHGIWRLYIGPEPCQGLLSQGQYRKSSWQPEGCMVHKYSKRDSYKCFRASLGPNHWAFFGDTRIKQIYLATANFLENGSDPKDYDLGMSNEDLRWQSKDGIITLDFFWTPVINESTFTVLDKWETNDSLAPDMILAGIGTDYIRMTNNSVEGRTHFERNATILRVHLDRISENGRTKAIWMKQPRVDYERLSPDKRPITNSALNYYNSLSESIMLNGKKSKILIWKSLAKLCQPGEIVRTSSDGINLPPTALKEALKILLNLQCNEFMDFQDGGCCKSQKSPRTLQILLLAFITLAMIVISCQVCFLHFHSPSCHSIVDIILHALVASNPSDQSGLMSTMSTQRAINMRNLRFVIFKICFIVFYIFLCDRTNYFMKENKYFTPFNFFLPVLYILVLGLFFNEESKQSIFLNRDQSDEWKGWMQLVIMIYQMTNASQSLPIYMNIRILVSSYLFLNGYGHFCDTWNRGDFSFRRYLKVIFRLNFLTVIFCFAMDVNYQFYHFVPLVTFWFSLQYLMMSIPPAVTEATAEKNQLHFLYVVMKIIFLTTLVSILYMSEVLFERIFSADPWNFLFVNKESGIQNWWYIWRSDRYSMIGGYLFGFIIVLARRYEILSDCKNSSNLFPNKIIRVFAVFYSFMGISAFLIFASFCRLKEDCIEIHPYVTIIPISSFLILRNLFGFCRSRYSSFFAWFGKISLELFICQYHIWLAKDSQGVLVLVPSYPMANLVLTSFIFLCICHELHKINNLLVDVFENLLSSKRELDSNVSIKSTKEKKNSLKSVIKYLLIIFSCFIPLGIYQKYV